MMTTGQDDRKRQARWMAVLLALVAIAVYAGFIWMTAKGML